VGGQIDVDTLGQRRGHFQLRLALGHGRTDIVEPVSKGPFGLGKHLTLLFRDVGVDRIAQASEQDLELRFARVEQAQFAYHQLHPAMVLQRIFEQGLQAGGTFYFGVEDLLLESCVNLRVRGHFVEILLPALGIVRRDRAGELVAHFFVILSSIFSGLGMRASSLGRISCCPKFQFPGPAFAGPPSGGARS
jgi:hypothetical protein